MMTRYFMTRKQVCKIWLCQFVGDSIGDTILRIVSKFANSEDGAKQHYSR